MMPIELISVVVPVTQDCADIEAAYQSYRTVLGSFGKPVEFIYVLDGAMPRAARTLRGLRAAGEPVEVLSFASAFGEAAALTVGFRHAAGDVVFTLTPRAVIAPETLPQLIEALATSDVAVARRMTEDGQPPRRRRKFDRMVNALFGTSLQDIRCGVRAMRAEVAKELTIYGNQHRFLPLLAQAQGFVVREVDLPAARTPERSSRLLPFDTSLVLDVITIYFLLRFVKKPFRFFGGFGLAVLAIGALFTAYLIAGRLFFDIPLVDRPALVLSTLMIVLGIQIISVGLIGEIVAFAYAKDIKDYRVDRIVDADTPDAAAQPAGTESAAPPTRVVANSA